MVTIRSVDASLLDRLTQKGGLIGDYLFYFKIGKYEIGMYKHFKCWYVYNARKEN